MEQNLIVERRSKGDCEEEMTYDPGITIVRICDRAGSPDTLVTARRTLRKPGEAGGLDRLHHYGEKSSGKKRYEP